YGAGSMAVWDTGTYDEEKWSDREVMVQFHGRRVEGRYVLFRTGGKSWMIHRMDPPTDPERQPPPSGVAPMWARPAPRLPGGAAHAWAADVAWGGARILLTVQGGRPLALHWDGPGRDPQEVTDRFPELRAVAATVGATELLVDGELVVTGADGRPDDGRLADRLGASGASVRRLAAAHPAVVMVADALWIDGHTLLARPLRERRSRLLEVRPGHPAWQAQPLRAGEVRALRDAARRQRLPGVVAKRVESAYEPGRVSEGWRMVVSA
ncbi:MAG TPA: DNA polymerase ligase N-terminal domain-containing protein, partial [Acidimicrobiales bacterium]